MSKNTVRAVLLAGVAVVIVACFPPPAVQPAPVQPQPVVYQQPVTTTYQSTAYTPQYYNGNVVYFDASGFPFYYLSGTQTYVPESCTCYVGLVNYYRTYSAGYAQWYASEGARLISLGLNLGL